MVEIPSANPNVALQAAIFRVRPETQLFYSITKRKPQSMEEFRTRAAKYIGQKDAIQSLVRNKSSGSTPGDSKKLESSVFARLDSSGGSRDSRSHKSKDNSNNQNKSKTNPPTLAIIHR